MPGLIALAVAMGIGRFAFTPLMPMMQGDAGARPLAGGLARLGQLRRATSSGALAAMRMHGSPGAVVRIGLAAIVADDRCDGRDAGMDRMARAALRRGSRERMGAGLRFLLGIPARGARLRGGRHGNRDDGLVCLALMMAHASSDTAWLALGAIALVASAGVWRTFTASRTQPPRPGRPVRSAGSRDRIVLVACYGSFGFGYIVPATFLPPWPAASWTTRWSTGSRGPRSGAAAGGEHAARGTASPARGRSRDLGGLECRDGLRRDRRDPGP
jgi:hypothetical protein